MFWSKKPDPPKPVNRRGRFRVAVQENIQDALTGRHGDRALVAGVADDLERFAMQLRGRLAMS
jgi:hypothetical protein